MTSCEVTWNMVTGAAGFLGVDLSGWIPSLGGRDVGIGRAHCVCDGGRGSDQPRTLIFREDGMTDRRSCKVLGRLIR